jgi:hypothetical protein
MAPVSVEYLIVCDGCGGAINGNPGSAAAARRVIILGRERPLEPERNKASDDR